MYSKEALDAHRSKFGNTHRDTLIFIRNMGSVLQALGDVNKNII